jgi:hypothetical protein
MTTSRRHFLSDGTLALAGVTAGTVTLLSACGSSSEPRGLRTASFGWDVNDLTGDSAYAYFKIAHPLILESINVDVSCAPSAGAANTGFAQVRCYAWASRGQAPVFSNGASEAPATADFGRIAIYNPNNLAVACEEMPLQDIFYSAILRSWVSADATDAVAERSVFGSPSLRLNTGDYLVFNINHAGVPGSVEMQVVLGYS